MIVLITGEPRAGKSYALDKIVNMLGRRNCAGLITTEMLEDNKRAGFATRGLKSKKRVTLAHRDFSKEYCVEIFGVNVKGLDQIIKYEYEAAKDDKDVEYIIVDEIGRMQMYSDYFISLLDKLAESDKTIIATICYGDEIDYIRKFKQRDGVDLYVLDENNRDEIPEKLVRMIKADDLLFLSKLKLAKLYQKQIERYEYHDDMIILHSTHDNRTLIKDDDGYHCTCDYYNGHGTCSHIMSLLLPK